MNVMNLFEWNDPWLNVNKTWFKNEFCLKTKFDPWLEEVNESILLKQMNHKDHECMS